MKGQKRDGLVPRALADEIARALAEVDERLADLEAAASAPWQERRLVYRRLRAAFDDADSLLREATALTRQRSHTEWSRWRHRLSRLSLARQLTMFAESDDMPVLGLGTVRAVDTGMSGPSIGDLQHGASKVPGAPATYGLDLDDVLASAKPTRAQGPAAPWESAAAATRAAVSAPAIPATASEPARAGDLAGHVVTLPRAVGTSEPEPVDAA